MPVEIDEIAVFVTPDGLGRAAIVRRQDGLFEIYEHWIWDQETKREFNVEPGGRLSWFDDETPPEQLYYDIDPQPGLFGTFEDAVCTLTSRRDFKDMRQLR